MKLYKVGGCIRDALLGRQSKDIDYAVEASSYDEMRQSLLDMGGEIFLEKPEYFTIRAKLNNEAADFVLCRKDGDYYDGRRPDSVSIGTIYDDLARRDFTMNAIAVDVETGLYLDPYNGVEDIAARSIVCVGKPKERFQEDYLRILRAIRFSIVLDFEIHTRTYRAMYCLGHLIRKVSTERIYEELRKCFKADTYKTLELLRDLELDSVLFNNALGDMDKQQIKLEPTLKQ